MRLTILVRADWTGLGVQTRDYYKHLNPTKTVVIDISSLNGNTQYYEWYNTPYRVKGLPTPDQIDFILSDTDVLLTAETPYNPMLYSMAKSKGVKTVEVCNPEFFDQFKYPEMPLPDMIILPSTWKEQEIRDYVEPKGVKVVQLHHPVDRNVYKYKHREGTRTFIVNGKPAVNDRNGMWDYLKAEPNPTVLTQDATTANQVRQRYRHSRVFMDIEDNTQLYNYGDIMVLPRRYGGNCLPLNEALSSGCPVIMPDISPNNHLLPSNWLVPARKVDSFTPRGKVDIYSVDIQALAERIAWVKQNIRSQSDVANELADSISWETLKPKYIEALESL